MSSSLDNDFLLQVVDCSASHLTFSFLLQFIVCECDDVKFKYISLRHAAWEERQLKICGFCALSLVQTILKRTTSGIDHRAVSKLHNAGTNSEAQLC
jgi:hypothetical protein